MENGSKDLQEYPLIIIEYHEKNIKEVQTQKLNTQMSHAPSLGERIKSHFSNNVQQKIIHPIQIKCNLKKKTDCTPCAHILFLIQFSNFFLETQQSETTAS